MYMFTAEKMLLNRKLKHIMTPICSIYGAFHGFCGTKLSHSVLGWSDTCVDMIHCLRTRFVCFTWRYPSYCLLPDTWTCCGQSLPPVSPLAIVETAFRSWKGPISRLLWWWQWQVCWNELMFPQYLQRSWKYCTKFSQQYYFSGSTSQVHWQYRLSQVSCVHWEGFKPNCKKLIQDCRCCLNWYFLINSLYLYSFHATVKINSKLRTLWHFYIIFYRVRG